jgi:hypothetical protein
MLIDEEQEVVAADAAAPIKAAVDTVKETTSYSGVGELVKHK